MRFRSLGLFTTLATASFLMAACGSSGSSSSGAAASSSSSSSGSAPEASPTGVPAVDHGSDLKTEPVIHAGTGTPSAELVTHDLVVGDGTVATATATVTIRYTGALYSNGKVFDDSPWTSNTPAVFPLNQVVPGFSQGIAGMKVGGRRELVIPPALGYGSTTNGPIPGNSTLVFVVDLLKVS